jgi:hypothetical protein
MATTDSNASFSHPVLRRTGVERGWLRHVLARLLRARAAAAPATPVTLDLACYDARSLVVRDLPFSVECVRGIFVITHPADSDDHVLRAGDRFEASGRGHMVIAGFPGGRVVVRGTIRSAGERRRRTWFGRARDHPSPVRRGGGVVDTCLGTRRG